MPLRKLTLFLLLFSLHSFSVVIFCVRLSDPKEGPAVRKIEPPSWFLGHTINPVQVLITGTNLFEASVAVQYPGIQVRHSRVTSDGHYLFTEFEISRAAKPGSVTVNIRTPHGSAHVDFVLQSALNEAGNFLGFSPDDVMYLIVVDRFANGDPTNDNPPGSQTRADRTNPRAYHGGDLRGIINHLSDLKDFGVTTLWLTPIYDNPDKPSVYHGYNTVDYYAVEEHFGTLEDFRELVLRAHALGLKVVQDQVANHVGPEHAWVTNPPAPDWFHGTLGKHERNNFDIEAIVNPHASPSDRDRPLNRWFGNRLPDLNQDNPDVARYLIQNALWWVDQTGLDGIRQDAVPYVPRTFWWLWSQALHKQHPRLKVVGEVSGTKPYLTAFFQGGAKRWDGVDSGLDTVFDFPLAAAMRNVFAKEEPMTHLREILAQDWIYPDPSVLVTFFGNQDWTRFLKDAGGDVRKLKLAAAFLLTVRGIPQLYYGDEIAMGGAGDRSNRADFLGSPSWGDGQVRLTDLQHETRHHFRKLLQLRQKHQALRRGELVQLMVDKESLLFMRSSPHEQIVVGFNNASNSRTLSVPFDHLGLSSQRTLVNMLAPGETIRLEEPDVKIPFGPKEAKIFLAAP